MFLDACYELKVRLRVSHTGKHHKIFLKNNFKNIENCNSVFFLQRKSFCGTLVMCKTKGKC